MRLDRRGLMLADGPELYQVRFAAPVDCPNFLARALQLSHAGHC